MNNWTEADNALRKIALIDLQVAEAAAVRDQKALAAQTEYQKETAPLLATRQVLVEELEAFYRSQRRKIEAEGKRSVELTYGRLGMRLGKPALALLKGWKWDRVLEAIKERWSRKPDLLSALVTVKESVNKEGVKANPDEEALAQIGLRIKQEDEFFLETFPERVKAA